MKPWVQSPVPQKQKRLSVCKNVNKWDRLSYMAGRNIKSFSHCEKQFGKSNTE
jgi:hypothetical protein